MAVDHPQRESRAICNFIIRDVNRIKIILYVLKIAYIDCEKVMHDIVQFPSPKQLNDGL